MSSKQLIAHPLKTQYITVRAPNLSDIQPPRARMTPEGKVKIDDRRPAVATLTV
jgi:hypothetical protein